MGDFPVRVTKITPVADTIKRFRLERADGGPLPVFSGGAHVVVSMNDNGQMRRNAYSLMSDPADPSAYEISVQKAEGSRGGSVFLHERLKEGDVLSIGAPVNLFSPDWRGRKHILIAGGIGITPFIAMMAQFDRAGIPFELHYAVRTRSRGAYLDDLAARYGASRVKVYIGEDGARIPLEDILVRQPLGTHLYVCGPDRMIDGVIEAGIDAGWPATSLHAERFLTPPPGKPFTVDLTRSRKTVPVGAHESILEALEAAGVDAPYLCRGGACGQCETGVAACEGVILHNDVYLSEEEKSEGRKIMICVSRIEGPRVALEL
ncbi:PDR/VanB family oxidoreductase [Ectorhizobium quercum]